MSANWSFFGDKADMPLLVGFCRGFAARAAVDAAVKDGVSNPPARSKDRYT
jgi:hypothetical protein